MERIGCFGAFYSQMLVLTCEPDLVNLVHDIPKRSVGLVSCFHMEWTHVNQVCV